MINAGLMLDMDSRSARLILHAVDESEARRLHDRAPQSCDAWAADYPFDGDTAAIDSFLRASEQNGEQRPLPDQASVRWCGDWWRRLQGTPRWRSR